MITLHFQKAVSYTTFHSASFLLSQVRAAFSLIFHTYVHVRIEIVQYSAKLMKAKFVEIRPFANKAVNSNGLKNNGFENLFYGRRVSSNVNFNPC